MDYAIGIGAVVLVILINCLGMAYALTRWDQ